jgi:carbon storage regulator
MLVLTRRLGETIIIGDSIRVTVTLIEGMRVRIGVVAPPEVRIDREEVRRARQPGTEQLTSLVGAHAAVE